MNLPAAIYAVRWLIRDTFRQALASGLFWLMLGVSTLCMVVCLSAGISGDVPLRQGKEMSEFLPRGDVEARPEKLTNSGVTVITGELTLLFGKMKLSLGRDGADAVHYFQLLLAGVVADAAGVLLALIWTAGFLPTFLEPGAAAVLLAKPVPRWSLLTGKYLGVLTFVAFQAIVFAGGTWAALGISTGIWSAAYLLCVPILLFHFAIFFSVSTLLAVCTRSTVTCILGSVLFWLLSWGMNYGRHAAFGLVDLSLIPEPLHVLIETGYWILPKPADLGLVLFDTLQADGSFGKPAALEAVQSKGLLYPGLSLLTSLIFTVVMLGAAAREFVTTDY